MTIDNRYKIFFQVKKWKADEIWKCRPLTEGKAVLCPVYIVMRRKGKKGEREKEKENTL